KPPPVQPKPPPPSDPGYGVVDPLPPPPEPPKKTGDLVITSMPLGAAIKVDGVDSGLVTPQTLYDLNEGTHIVTLTLPGGEPETFSVKIKAGKLTREHHVLKVNKP